MNQQIPRVGLDHAMGTSAAIGDKWNEMRSEDRIHELPQRKGRRELEQSSIYT